jgi:two-component system, NtrC family, sensor kinase
VARSWRLRHKLTLGLALVVASVALLLGGAIFGLTSYSQTIRTTNRKLDEIQIVTILKAKIQSIPFTDSESVKTSEEADPTPINREREHIKRGISATRETLKSYRITLQNQYPTGSDGSLHEYALIDRMESSNERLQKALDRATHAKPGSQRLFDDSEMISAHRELERQATEHFDNLVDDAKHSFQQSTANHRRSMFIAGFATIMAVVLVLTLLYYFRVWVLTPIQVLQAGVHRVRMGIFHQPIQLHSQDEFQEFADEFNTMSTQVGDNRRDLESQVNERTRQLVRSERMVSVGFLAAGVAHEINNPLASIAFCAEALERRLGNNLPQLGNEGEVVAKYLRMIQEESQRCKEITQKLLDFSRSGGKRERGELAQLVVDVIEVASVLPNARNKSIYFAPQASVMVPMSAPDIKSVVLNLIVNALDSMDEQGGRLEIELRQSHTHAELTFRDTGCGMSGETLQNIFEPFYTRSRTGNGTGLGLSISHQIIDQHGGTISATSAGPNQGSTFTVTLPLNTPAELSENTPALLPFPNRNAAVA